MPVRYAPVREVVIVISDLYLPEETAGAASVKEAEAPGFEQVARFGVSVALGGDWRSWLAGWVGRADLADVPPAVVAAAAADIGPVQPDSAVWLATPVHFIAGLSSVHLPPAGLLYLPQDERQRLVEDFLSIFGSSGYRLVSLETGGFLVITPPVSPVRTVDPARWLGSNVAEALPGGEGAAALRRLGTEIEMWLHEHPVNAERAARRQPVVSGLWLWGGGSMVDLANDGSVPDSAFGSEDYLAGLWRACGGQTSPLPRQFSDLLGDAAPRAALLLQATRGASEASGSLADALAHLDRQWISPAVEALRAGQLGSLSIVANDRQWSLRRRDFLRRWRRPRRGWTGLQ